MNDTMQDAGLGVPTEAEKKLASDFAELEGERVQRWDRRMNVVVTMLIVMAAAAAIFWPGV